MTKYFYSTIAILVATPLYANDMLTEIETRAGSIKTIRAKMNSDDKNIKLAALDVMLKSKDTALRESAYREVFAGNDADMTVIALKNKFNDISRLSLTIDKSAIPQEQQEKLQPIQSVWVSRINAYKENSGTMSFGSTSSANANLSGMQFVFETSIQNTEKVSCNGQASYTGNATFTGQLVCNNVVMPMNFKVF